MPSRWRIPPEYVDVRRSAASASPTRSRMASTRPASTRAPSVSEATKRTVSRPVIQS